ncbi:MAG: four helix bundle protein [Gemmatimonadetes bacterium]|nr:four helix bundle protein [Gemmatimonadota bacterium]
MASHRTLKAWQHAKILAVDCAKAARRFPPEEQTALADQLRRAAYSAALNIAEGSGRRGARDYRKFLVTARASLDEVEAILEIARDLGYIDPSAFARLEARRDEAAKTLYGLIRSLESRAAMRPAARSLG